MTNVLLICYTIVVIALIAIVLLQKSERGALGLGDSSGGLGSHRRKPDLLVRITQGLGATFMALSLILSVLATRTGEPESSRLLEEIERLEQTVPGTTTAPTAPAAPGPDLQNAQPPAPTPDSNTDQPAIPQPSQ